MHDYLIVPFFSRDSSLSRLIDINHAFGSNIFLSAVAMYCHPLRGDSFFFFFFFWGGGVGEGGSGFLTFKPKKQTRRCVIHNQGTHKYLTIT